MTSILFTFGLLSTFIAISQCELTRVQACEGHIMELFCENNKVIRVNWANYGRTDNSICLYFEDIEATDCRMEKATDIVKNSCDGKEICFIEAINEIFGDPCPDQVKYVEATFECVPKRKPESILDPNDLTVVMQENKLLEILKDLGEKDSKGQDLKQEQALGLLNLFANAEAEAEDEHNVPILLS